MNISCYLKLVALCPVGAYAVFVIASLINTGKPDFSEISLLYLGGGYVVTFCTALIFGLPYLVIQNIRPLNAWLWFPILLCLGGIGGNFLRLAFFGRSPASTFITEPSVFIAAGVGVAFSAWLLASFICHQHVKIPKRYLVWLIIALGVFTLGISIIHRVSRLDDKVRSSASALAGSTPYCIQVPYKGDYVEAKSASDISPLRKRGSGGLNHGVLIIWGEEHPRFFHWSYRSESFVDGAYGPPAIYCKPRVDFLARPQLPQEDSANLRFYFVGHFFSVPRVYRPSVNWASRKALVFYATAPEFEPSPDKYATGSFIDLVFGKSPLLPSWLDTADAVHVVETVEPEFGLQKQLVWYRNHSMGKKEKLEKTQYFIRDKSGDISTLIICMSRNCTHIFESKGWSYYFHHTVDNLSSWKSMQEKLTSLANSFVVSK